MQDLNNFENRLDKVEQQLSTMRDLLIKLDVLKESDRSAVTRQFTELSSRLDSMNAVLQKLVADDATSSEASKHIEKRIAGLENLKWFIVTAIGTALIASIFKLILR